MGGGEGGLAMTQDKRREGTVPWEEDALESSLREEAVLHLTHVVIVLDAAREQRRRLAVLRLSAVVRSRAPDGGPDLESRKTDRQHREGEEKEREKRGRDEQATRGASSPFLWTRGPASRGSVVVQTGTLGPITCVITCNAIMQMKASAPSTLEVTSSRADRPQSMTTRHVSACPL